MLQKASATLGIIAVLLGAYLLFGQDDSVGIMVIALGLIAIVLPNITGRANADLKKDDSDAR